MGIVEDGRTACVEHRWGDARRLLGSIERDALEIDDLDRFATSALMTGHDADAFGAWTQAHQRCVADGELHRAANFGVKIAQGLGFKGDIGRCHGWIDRIARLLDEAGIDCVEAGYLEHGHGMLRIFEAGDLTGAQTHFRRAGKIGARFGHRELIALAQIGEGRMLIYLGEIRAGVALLDEAIVSIEAGELSTVATGDAYCTVIDACAELFDIERCRAWTDSLSRWCDTQQDLVLYRGQCFMHRAEVLTYLGIWPEALAQARQACDRLAAPVQPATLGGAVVVEGDLQRLTGDLGAAEAAYQRASEFGAEPQPGLALLRLAQGRVEAADAMIRRALSEGQDSMSRARLLGAYVEIALAYGDADAARVAASDFRVIAHELGTPLLSAEAAHATGAVLLTEGDAHAALPELRRAFTLLNNLGVRYRASRVRLLIAQACDALGDHDAATIESAAAMTVLRTLTGPGDTTATTSTDAPDGLTPRELDVLRLLAQGKTNRVISDELFVSEKTVATHVSHIFTKLGVRSRSAATAYAYDHDLT